VGVMAVPVMVMRMAMGVGVIVGVPVNMGHGQLSKPGWRAVRKPLNTRNVIL
jgi:hypothetical protein